MSKAGRSKAKLDDGDWVVVSSQDGCQSINRRIVRPPLELVPLFTDVAVGLCIADCGLLNLYARKDAEPEVDIVASDVPMAVPGDPGRDNLGVS